MQRNSDGLLRFLATDAKLVDDDAGTEAENEEARNDDREYLSLVHSNWRT
jgi:hypothetical protein